MLFIRKEKLILIKITIQTIKKYQLNLTVGQWIQLSSPQFSFFKGIIIQGRGDRAQWVKSLKISYSVDGRFWDYVEDGKNFIANTDRNTHVRIIFKEPVFARAIRINPISWQEYPSLRFEVIKYDMSE